MSRTPGYHHESLWPEQTEPRPAPCFHCGTEPRLDGHVCCSGCHDELRCGKCNPHLVYATPAHLSRGVQVHTERKFV